MSDARRLCALLAVVVFPWSCATGPTPMTAQGEDGSCDNDGDCQIVDYDVELVSCCGGTPLEPYAVSKAAVERHIMRRNAKCTDAVCTMIRRVCCSCTKKRDWIAVCSRHVCQRRSVSFFSPKPRCE